MSQLIQPNMSVVRQDARMAQPTNVLVAGGCRAGIRTVEQIRARGFRGVLTLLAAEQQLTGGG